MIYIVKQFRLHLTLDQLVASQVVRDAMPWLFTLNLQDMTNFKWYQVLYDSELTQDLMNDIKNPRAL